MEESQGGENVKVVVRVSLRFMVIVINNYIMIIMIIILMIIIRWGLSIQPRRSKVSKPFARSPDDGDDDNHAQGTED